MEKGCAHSSSSSPSTVAVISNDTLEPTVVVDDYPVIVRNAYKSFPSQMNGEDSVLLDLNMKVKKGTIYGLLGPSGCGKTTLLRCIIGRIRLDSGEVLTLGQIPGTFRSGIPGPRIGYMPQEDALDGIMTIKELLNYYGCILGMDKKRIEEKTAFLVSFLKLPSKKTVFRTLSGGQKRRVSFAVALIHDAELLILDEPTVGVDPILKQSIWDYLFELVQNGKTTVIITTHYIEEARGANFVGMMFEGRLLAEDEPERLVTSHGMGSLEAVFLSICVDDKHQMNLAAISSNEFTNSSKGCSLVNDGVMVLDDACTIRYKTSAASAFSVCNLFLESYSDIKWRRLQAVIYRGLIQFIRFPGLLFLLMASPAFQIALCGFSLGRSVHSVPLGVVNMDVGHLGDKFLSIINDEVIVQRNYSTWDLARQGTRDGETWGAIMFGDNFTTSIVERFNNTPHVDRKTLLESCINVSLDGSNFLFVETIRFTLLDAFEKFVVEVLNEFKLEQSLAKIPLVRENPVFGKLEDPYSVFIMPSFITGSAFFAEMGLSIIAFFLDKEGGKLERIYVAGVTPIEVIFGFLVLQMVILMAEVIFMLIMALVIFRFTNDGSLLLIVALSVLQGLCGATIGMLVAASSKKFPDTSSVTMAILVSSVAIGGYFWPLEATTPIVRWVCNLLPFALSANAMRHIMYRRWDLTHPEIYRAFGISLFWVVVFMIASVIVFRMKKAEDTK